VTIVRRVLTLLTVLAALSGCLGPPGSTTSPGDTAAPTAVITSEMVRITESTILQGLDSAIEDAFQTCKTGAQQGGDAAVSDCNKSKTTSLEARKALVACFARADQAPTPAESISAIMRCQLPSPAPSRPQG
jgi:hypothetical protein